MFFVLQVAFIKLSTIIAEPEKQKFYILVSVDTLSVVFMDDSAVRGYLGIKNLVGVKINRDSEAPDGKRPKNQMTFCQMVDEATKGRSFIFGADDLKCPNALIALGFQEPSFLEVPMRITPSDVKSVEVAPVKEMDDPDVVLAVLNPSQLMRIGEKMGYIDARFKGDMAVCGEATAQVYMTKKPNITPLCGGSRKFASYKPSELILGAPPELFKELGEKVGDMASAEKASNFFKRLIGR